MWTAGHRERHQRVAGRYPSDVTDAEWALLAPLLPPAKKGGRPRTTDMRAVIDALFYLLRTGCQWRQLPTDFPPKTTVYDYFAAWRRRGLWADILHHLVLVERERSGKAANPSAVILDSQSVKGAQRGALRSRRPATMPARRCAASSATPRPTPTACSSPSR